MWGDFSLKQESVKDKVILPLVKAVRKPLLKTVAIRERDWAHLLKDKRGFIAREQSERSVDEKLLRGAIGVGLFLVFFSS